MQATGQERQAGRASRGSGARLSGAAAAADGVAEFREIFVSLVDPAGLLDMEASRRTAGRMEEAASMSRCRAGARMAAILSDMFAATYGIAGRPVEDGSLGRTRVSHGLVMGGLYDTAEAYMGGRDAEPVGELEDARDMIECQRGRANRRREQLRAAGGPPGASLPGIERMHAGRVCRDVAGEGQERARARQREWGNDPVFPPKAGAMRSPRRAGTTRRKRPTKRHLACQAAQITPGAHIAENGDLAQLRAVRLQAMPTAPRRHSAEQRPGAARLQLELRADQGRATARRCRINSGAFFPGDRFSRPGLAVD